MKRQQAGMKRLVGCTHFELKDKKEPLDGTTIRPCCGTCVHYAWDESKCSKTKEKKKIDGEQQTTKSEKKVTREYENHDYFPVAL